MDPWDVAAGRLLVEEAGGRITDFAGRPAPVDQVIDLVATNGHIHEALLAVLGGADRHREEP
jgi:myo-inositol-1(or 4)-monophosphatase